MEENDTKQVVYQKYIKTDYYEKKSQKVGDFFLGLILTILVLIIVSVLSLGIPFWFSVIAIVGLLLIGVYYSKKNRRYVTIGIISASLLIVLGFGSCLSSLNIGASMTPSPYINPY